MHVYCIGGGQFLTFRLDNQTHKRLAQLMKYTHGHYITKHTSVLHVQFECVRRSCNCLPLDQHLPIVGVRLHGVRLHFFGASSPASTLPQSHGPLGLPLSRSKFFKFCMQPFLAQPRKMRQERPASPLTAAWYLQQPSNRKCNFSRNL